MQQGVSTPVNSIPQRAANAPANAVPIVMQSVKISNPAALGVDLSFVFGGKTFTVESGQTKDFSISAPTLIVFNRGSDLGDARYTLSGGSTFEFKYDNAGWSMVQKRREQIVAKVTEAGATPANPAPRPLNNAPQPPTFAQQATPAPVQITSP